MKKNNVCIRLTDNGILKLTELSSELGMNKSTLVELLVTLYHEKQFKLKGGILHVKT